MGCSKMKILTLAMTTRVCEKQGCALLAHKSGTRTTSLAFHFVLSSSKSRSFDQLSIARVFFHNFTRYKRNYTDTIFLRKLFIHFSIIILSL